MTEHQREASTSSTIGETQPTGYGSFRSPLTLAGRLLARGGPVGKRLLAREALRWLTWPADLLLYPLERRLVAKPGRQTFPLLLIVGPPRSGTTLVYQVLASCLDVSYFSNCNALFPRSPLAAARLFGHNVDPGVGPFQSLYGNTRTLRDVNDGFHIWNRFLGEDRYTAPGSVSPAVAGDMAHFLSSWSRIARKPLLNKNNRNLACASLLAAALPNAHFLIVRRDPHYVAQSLLNARDWIQGSRKRGWGLNSEDSSPATDPVETVCRQVCSNEELISRQREAIGSDRCTDIAYEDFCAAPTDFVQQVAAISPFIKVRSPERLAALPRLTSTNQSRITDDEERRISQYLTRDLQRTDNQVEIGA